MRPSGTITFLFTDIEGSTRLWQAQPEAMQMALRRHDALLHEVIEAGGGYVFKTVGDAFFCAFQTPSEALEAAIDGQRRLIAEAWPAATGSLRVRMALHSGAAEERDSDYFGVTLNRLARLLSAGHGGQTLLSAATAALVRDSLPPGCRVRSLGSHRLKDLFEPEDVFQLLCDGLPADFPPLRSLNGGQNNLPIQMSALIGREKESEAIRALLDRPDVRLVTLTGVGGTGKTRLALKAAADTLDRYDYGVWFVDLSSVTAPEAVPSAIVAALDLAIVGQEPLAEALKTYLRGRKLLLLLDNFEQVISAGRFVGELLAAAPHLRILATSREPLLISGEHEFAVLPLSLPVEGQTPEPATLRRYDSVALFIDRAKAVRHDFELNDHNAAAVAAICVRLDGLPLAIELAAARVRLFPPAVLLARLDDRLGMLSGGRRDAPERQRTLRAAIDWSYDLLGADERVLFQRLSVFSGGFDPVAAGSSCGQGLQTPILDGLESLLNKSLIRRVEGAEDDLRFALLETIRAYAEERLVESGEHELIQDRHAAYYDDLSGEAADGLRAADQLALLDRLDRDRANLRSALNHLIEQVDPTAGARMVVNLRDYWLYSYQHAEGEEWLRRALLLEERVPDEVRVDLLTAAGMTALYRAKLREARNFADQALDAARSLGDRRRLAWASTWWTGCRLSATENPDVRSLILAAIETFKDIEYYPGLTQAMNVYGEYLRMAGDLDGAETIYRDVIPLAQAIGDFRRVIYQYMNLGTIAFVRRQDVAMKQAVQRGLRLSLEMRVEDTTASFLVLAAALANQAGAQATAATLIGAADAWYEDRSVTPQLADSAALAAMRRAAREGQANAEYQAGWSRGRALSLPSAVALAEEMLTTVKVGSD